MLARVCTRQDPAGPNYCTRSETVAKSRQQTVCVLTILFMNVRECVERREGVQELPGVDKLLTLCIFSVESRILAHADTRGFLVNVSKFV